jgi:hypothetical protein
MEQLPVIIAPSGELDASGSASREKAMVEAGFIVAMKAPRNFDQVRQEVLSACRRYRLADNGIYDVAVGGGKRAVGPNILLLRAIKTAYRHISIKSYVTYNDDNMQKVLVAGYDLERNLPEELEIVVTKTVERRNPKNREVLSERLNSEDKKVYTVKATDDEVHKKMLQMLGKAQRKILENLIPFDLVDEAMAECYKTLERGSGDPDADRKVLCDSFAEIGVQPINLEAYLRHSISQITPKELADLRVIYRTIKAGEATFFDYLDREDDTLRGSLNVNDFKPKPPEPREAPQGANSSEKTAPVGASGSPPDEDSPPDSPSADGESKDSPLAKSAEGLPPSMDLRAEWEAFKATLKTPDERTKEWTLVKKTFKITREDQVSGLPGAFIDFLEGRYAANQEGANAE